MSCFSANKSGNTEHLHMSAITSGSEENKAFSKLTPTASLDMCIDNPDAQGLVVPGREYYVDIIEVEKPEATPPADNAHVEKGCEQFKTEAA